MEPRKLTKEDLDKVRGIEGFPIGSDEDIIALSDAPYYTACPNPFIGEFIAEHGTPYDEATDDYHCEPFAADVSEGKNDPIYMAHSYHTKVPYKAIMRYILHYTKPNDIVLDGFCGTGMTGVAAQMCGCPDDDTRYTIERDESSSSIAWGKRNAIVSDLAPIASFISHTYNHSCKSEQFYEIATRIIQECKDEFGWMFQTVHVDDQGRPVKDITGANAKGELNYVVWSDVFICPTCSREFTFWDVAVDNEHGKVMDSFYCPHCHTSLSKRDCTRAVEGLFDTALQKDVQISKQVPVLIAYFYSGKRYQKKPDLEDLELIKKIEDYSIPYSCPTVAWPIGEKTKEPISRGIEYVHQMYTKRNLAVLAAFCAKAKGTPAMILMHSVATVNSKLYRYRWAGGVPGAGGGPLSGTLYIPSILKDISMLKSLSEYAEKTRRAKLLQEKMNGHVCVSIQSATNLPQIRESCIDYIFTDPPFGNNLNYSELSFIWEAWLGVITNNSTEAIINPVQKKGLAEYQDLMTKCFEEYYRVLKPNRWITVEFHNSKNSVWNSIQEALQKSGFIVADVRVISKKQGSFNQVTAAGAVQQDLVISAYKPKESFRKNFFSGAGTEESAWAFVRQHLDNIPVVVIRKDKIEIIAERQPKLLFDRMVAYHIVNGIPIPIDATDFYKGLAERFLLRDGMYFLPDQINEYDTARIKNDIEPIQFSMFVTNEKSAISWLYQQLSEANGGPQTYAELQPKFMQEVKSIDRYEDMPELAVLLEENFLEDEEGRWYIPDVTKEGDLTKLREKKLWKEFEGYMASKGKLKLFRSEAIRVGFSRLWKDKNYAAIVAIAERLPEQTIQEDPNLLMYYDISLSRV